MSLSDRTLVSEGPACPVKCGSEDANVGQLTERWVAQRPNAGWLYPVVLSDSAVRSHSVTRRWQGLVEHDRTRPVEENRFWNLTGNDRTLVAQRPVSSKRYVWSTHVTVEIGTHGCRRATGR